MCILKFQKDNVSAGSIKKIGSMWYNEPQEVKNVLFLINVMKT